VSDFVCVHECVCVSVCIYKYICMYISRCKYIVCMYVHTCIRMYMGVHICVYVYVCKSVFIYYVCLVACCSDPDLFGKIRTCYGRFKVVLVIDLIHWRFEDRCRTGSCSEDQTVIRFQNHVISCVFIYWSISISAFHLNVHVHVYIILHYSVHAGHYCRFISLF